MKALGRAHAEIDAMAGNDGLPTDCVTDWSSVPFLDPIPRNAQVAPGPCCPIGFVRGLPDARRY
ncbi:hypothetical protein PAXINDRAFT_166800 [Paxillus involutus ATCC 200175]|nr:hypothetical protein PAXINDRAFT_166800 [Paxillus involutus ATCC 200175]